MAQIEHIPFFHSVMGTKMLNKNKTRKHSCIDSWSGLSDGVFGTYVTKLKLVKCLVSTIDPNSRWKRQTQAQHWQQLLFRQQM